LCAELGFQRESEICADVAMEYDGTFEREVFEKWGKYTAGMELVEQALKR
jgi:hypothetical protein